MVATYYEIGRMIVEEEQFGKERADYGTELLTNLSKELLSEFGKGFSRTNIDNMHKFYKTYSIVQSLTGQFKLSWIHYTRLMRMSDENERKFYEIESINNRKAKRHYQRTLRCKMFLLPFF